MTDICKKLRLQNVQLLQFLVCTRQTKARTELSISYLPRKMRTQNHKHDRCQEKEIVVQQNVEPVYLLIQQYWHHVGEIEDATHEACPFRGQGQHVNQCQQHQINSRIICT